MCEYCEFGKPMMPRVIDMDGDPELVIENSELFFDDGNDEAVFKINNCPMCGRDLRSETSASGEGCRTCAPIFAETATLESENVEPRWLATRMLVAHQHSAGDTPDDELSRLYLSDHASKLGIEVPDEME